MCALSRQDNFADQVGQYSNAWFLETDAIEDEKKNWTREKTSIGKKKERKKKFALFFRLLIQYWSSPEIAELTAEEEKKKEEEMM